MAFAIDLGSGGDEGRQPQAQFDRNGLQHILVGDAPSLHIVGLLQPCQHRQPLPGQLLSRKNCRDGGL
ncbi:hypothetical protein D3C77_624500 [compost metagenome]